VAKVVLLGFPEFGGDKMPDQMPRSVWWFEKLCYAGMVLVIASIPLNWATIGKFFFRYPVIYPLTILMFFVVQLFWIRLVSRRRRNRARWVSLVVMAMGLIQELRDAPQRLQLGLPSALTYWFVNGIFALAIGLLFTRDAAPWFRRQAAERVT
jgi:hypothetical protein